MSKDPLLAAIAESSPDTLLLLNRDGRIQFVNRVVPGLTEEGVVGTWVYDYVDESQHADMRRCFEEVARTRQPGTYHNVYVTRDTGQHTIWESRVGALVNQDEVTGYVVLCRDVTEARAIAADRDRLFELSMDLMCTLDFSGHFRRISPSFTRLLGYPEQTLLAGALLDLVHPEDQENTSAALARLATGHSVERLENRVRHRDGTHRILHWHAVPDLPLSRIHAVARDETEHRLAQARQLQTSKLEALGQLTGGIAHDFNNLLLAILSNAELASRFSVPDGPAALHIGEIVESAHRAADLTQQMLMFGRQHVLRTEALDLNHLLDGLLRLLSRLIPENIHIRVERGRGLPAVHGDRGQLEQVVLNLCVNARDAMPKGGTLVLRTEEVTVDPGHSAKPGRYVQLTVEDTGVGISAADQQRIFDPFYTTKAPGEGVGLGLATVYGVVQQHSGVVQVSSAEGRGARFEVLLPAADVASHPPEVRTPPRPRRGSETILVAEDEELVRRVVCRLLEEAGYRTLSAEDGEQAIAVLREHPGEVSLALLDVVMPRLGGVEAQEKMREIDPSLRILLTSGYTGRAAKTVGLPDDVDFLPKPYGGDELLRMVRTILDRDGALST